MNCPSADQLSRFAAGTLDDARGPLEEHLGDCAECRVALAACLEPADENPRLGHRYRLGRLLGRGSGAEVFLAQDEQLGRAVAVKVLTAREVDPLAAARLLQEARFLAGVSHPHVLEVYDAGVHDGRAFLVMQLAEGSLADRLKSGPLGWRDACELFADAASGLFAAHRAGVIHRDVKPANLLLDPHGRVQVADFGLAATTAAKDVAGTPAYMSPEVVGGARATERSDQFSLCASLFEALAGERPFPVDSVERHRQALQRGPPPLPRGVPSRLAAAVRRGLAESPTARFQDLDALQLELRRVLDGPRRRRRWLSAAVLVFLFAGAAVTWRAVQPSRCESARSGTGVATVEARGGEVEKALAKAGARGAALVPQFHTRVAALLQQFDAEWSGSCRATWDENRHSLAELTRVQQCLSAQVDQLRATLEQVATRVGPAPELALDALDATDFEACRTPQSGSLVAWVGRPRDAPLREAVSNLIALRTVQDFQLGIAQAERLRDEARAQGRKSVEAEACFWLGTMQQLQGVDVKVVLATYDRVVLLSEETGDDRLRARALVSSAFAESVFAQHHDAAHRLLDQAAAVFTRVDPSREDPELLYTRATVFSKEKKSAEAEALFRRLIDITSPQSADSIQLLRSLARSVLRQKHCAEAQRLYLEALSRARTHYGESHPMVSALWNDLGTAYADAGQLSEALAAMKKADGPEHGAVTPLNVLITRMHQLDLAAQLAPSPEKVTGLRALLAEVEKTPNASFVASRMHWVLAQTLRQLERLDEASAEAAAFTATTLARLKADHPDVAQARCLEASLLEQSGHLAEAAKLYQLAVDQLAEPQRAMFGGCAQLGLARLSPENLSARLDAVFAATDTDDTLEGRLLRAEAFLLNRENEKARAAVSGLQGRRAERMLERIGR